MKSNSRTFLDVMDTWAGKALHNLESQGFGAQKGRPGKQHPLLPRSQPFKVHPCVLGSKSPRHNSPWLKAALRSTSCSECLLLFAKVENIISPTGRHWQSRKMKGSVFGWDIFSPIPWCRNGKSRSRMVITAQGPGAGAV